MHRRYVRAIINVDSTEKDIPIDFIADGHVLVYKDNVIKTDTLVLADVVTGVGTSSLNEIPVYYDATGRVITSSGALITDVVFASSTAVVNRLASYSDISGRFIQDSNVLSTNVVQNTGGTVTSGTVALFSGTSGRNVVAASFLGADVVRQTAGSVTAGNVASYSGATGRLVADSGFLATDVVRAAGGTVTVGNLPQYSGTTGRLITDTGINTTNVVTNFTTLPLTLNNIPVFTGGSNRALSDSGVGIVDVVRRATTSSTIGDVPQYTNTTGNSVSDSGINTANVVLSFGASNIAGHLTSYTASGATRVLQDSGIVSADVVTQASGSVTATNLASYSSSTGRIIIDSGILSANVVLNTGGTVVAGNIAVFSGTTGRRLQDTGISGATLVAGPGGGSTNNALAAWNGTSGTSLRNTGVSESSGVLSMTGLVVSGNASLNTVNTSIPANNIVSYNAAAAGALTNEVAAFDTGSFPFKVSYRQVQITPAGAISQVTSLNGTAISDFVTISGGHATDSIATWVSVGGTPILQDSPVLIIGTDVQGINNISVSTINGFDPDSHASRHYTFGGADSIIASGSSWTTRDVLRYSGSQFDPRNITCVNTNGVAVGTGFVTIANVTLGANAGGTYVGRVSFPLNQGDTSGNINIAVAWSVGATVTATVGGVAATGVITSSGGSISRPASSVAIVMLVEIIFSITGVVANTNITISAQKTSGASGSSQPGAGFFIQI